MDNKRNFNINDYKTQTVKVFTFEARLMSDFTGKSNRTIKVRANNIDEAVKALGRVDRKEGTRTTTYIPVNLNKVEAVLEGMKREEWDKLCEQLEVTDITTDYLE